jgi:hypothetical protein
MPSTLLSPCCGCVAPTCNVTFNVKGCASTNLTGATVNIWNNSGMTSLIATGTTNSSGNVILNIGTAGTYWREITHPRFVTQSGSISPGCGGTLSTSFTTPAVGYVCCPGSACGLPLATTLFLTIAGNTYTLTYDSGQGAWYGTATHTDPLITNIGPFPACTCTGTTASQTVVFVFVCSGAGPLGPGLNEGYGQLPTTSSCGTNKYTGITYTSPAVYTANQPTSAGGCSGAAIITYRNAATTVACNVPSISGTMAAFFFGPPITGAFTITE